MAENVKMIFKDYILPYLERVQSMEDFKAIFDEVKAITPRKDLMLLTFFYTKLNSGMFDNNLPNAIQHYKELGITRADVEGNMWHVRISQKSVPSFSQFLREIEHLH